MKRHNKAFTLVELIIVIAVIGVLAAILIPVFSNVVEKANAKSALSDARNTLEQILVEAAENDNIPQNLVIFVKKAGNWYVYGYNRELGGKLQVSEGNPYSGTQYRTIADLNTAYGWSGTDEPQPNGSYDLETDGAFYLVPSADRATSSVRGIPTRDLQSGMDNYTDVTELYMGGTRMGNDAVAYHGVLLNGTWGDEDTATGGSGGSSGGNTDPVTPPNTNTFTINFAQGEAPAGLLLPTNLTLPESVTKNEGEIFALNETYNPTYDANDDIYFSHWEEGGNIVSGETFEYDAGGNNTHNLVAVWAPVAKYTITLDLNGGTMPNTLDTYGFSTSTSTRQVRTDSDTKWSDIIGWFNSETPTGATTFKYWAIDGVEYNMSTNASNALTGDVTVSAVYAASYQVRFDVNGGTFTGTLSDYEVMVEVGTAITFPEDPTPASVDKQFDGWRSEKWGEFDYAYGASLNMPADPTLTNGELVFTAHYSDISYTITFEGGTGSGTYQVTRTPSSNTYTFVNPETDPDFSGTGEGQGHFAAPAGMEFDKWQCTAPTASAGTEKNAGDEITVSGDMTWTAQWKYKTFTITYDANGGTGADVPSATNFTYEGANPSVHVSAVPAFTKADNVLSTTVWNTAADGSGTDYNANTDYPVGTGANEIAGNLTLYAKWTVNYTITYKANGSGESDQVVDLGTNSSGTTTIAANPFTYTGHNFTGWYTNSSGTGGTAYAAGDSYTAAASLTLYAQWTEVPSGNTVTYHANFPTGASGTGGPNDTGADVVVDVTSGDDYTVLGNTDAGLTHAYAISGSTSKWCVWNTEANGSGTTYSANQVITGLSTSLDLYAVWSWDGTWDKSTEPAQDSNGTYLVYTPMELVWCAAQTGTHHTFGTSGTALPWSDGVKIKLMADIYLNLNVVNAGYTALVSAASTYNEWKGFGYKAWSDSNFHGEFDGNNHTIHGVYMVKAYYWDCYVSTANPSTNRDQIGSSTNNEYIGFFPCLTNGAKIKNVKFADSYVGTCTSSNNTYVGGVVGYTAGASTLEGVEFDGMVNGGSTTASVGGIMGRSAQSSGKTTIKNCSFNGRVRSYYVGATVANTGGQGGIIGQVAQTSYGVPEVEIIGCTVSGTITNSGYQSASSPYMSCGGIVGKMRATTANVSKCTNNATIGTSDKSNSTIKGGYSCSGGIIGLAYNTTTLNVFECKNTGKVMGSLGGVAGILGFSSGSTTVSVYDCYNTGEINNPMTGTSNRGSNEKYRGGISGCSATATTVSRCYTTGHFTFGTSTSTKAGGFICPAGTVTNCYYLSSLASDLNSVQNSGTGTAVADMTDSSVISGLGAKFTSEALLYWE